MVAIYHAVLLRLCCADVQVRHCNNSLKHMESTYYDELAEGFSHLVKGCKGKPEVGHCHTPPNVLSGKTWYNTVQGLGIVASLTAAALALTVQCTIGVGNKKLSMLPAHLGRELGARL